METKRNKETIGEWFNDYIDNYINECEEKVAVLDNPKDYLNKEDAETFTRLTNCTSGFCLTATIFEDEPDTVVVTSDSSYIDLSYDTDCPTADVFQDVLLKMKDELESIMESVKEAYKQGETRHYYGSDEYNAIEEFGEDYGIEYIKDMDNSKGSYVEVTNIYKK